MADESLACLLPADLTRYIDFWAFEDVPSFDYGGFVVGSKQEHAVLFAKSRGVLAGLPFFQAVFKYYDCKVEWLRTEGEELDPPEGGRLPVAHVYGASNRLLQGERIALNILARASGIATRSRRMIEVQEFQRWKGTIAGTRKTTPGFRLVEKYAMLVGGADGHRMDLSSMIMLKDNHIWSHGGSIEDAIVEARKVGGFSLKVEVECRSYEEARIACIAGADVIMLDNFTAKDGHAAAGHLKNEFPHVMIELSGGLTEANICDYMHPAVDILSSGALSQGVPHVDFSLKVQRK